MTSNKKNGIINLLVLTSVITSIIILINIVVTISYDNKSFATGNINNDLGLRERVYVGYNIEPDLLNAEIIFTPHNINQ